MIKIIQNAQPIDPETAPDREQKVTYKRTATVNPETGEVTYSDWTVMKEQKYQMLQQKMEKVNSMKLLLQ